MTTLLVGGRVHSPVAPDATALAVTDGPDAVVSWLGADEVGRARFPDARVVELGGGFVTPGFVDGHVHITATGLTIVGLDLRAATSKAHLLRLLGEHGRRHPDGLVWAHGWDESGWSEAVPPTTAELDDVLGPRPAYLARVDVHSACASSALRARVPGLSGELGYQPDLPLTADAHHAVRAVARDLLSDAQRRDARTAALDLAARQGIVAVHECAGPEIGGLDDWLEVAALAHGVDVVGYWGEAVESAEQVRVLLEKTGARGLAGDLFVDGALGSRTAWLHAPYADQPGCHGNSYLDADAIAAHVAACTEVGIPAGFHVIGDAAVAAVVEAIDRVIAHFGAPAVARCGHRLEHLEMVTSDEAARLGAAGVIASVQPNFDALWGGESGMYAQRLGARRASGLNPLALLASQGVPLAFGSDSPVTGLDPWATVQAAINHRTAGSSLSSRAAFAAATRGAWRAAGVRDGVTGTLVPGAQASYAIWDLAGGALEVAAPVDGVQRWSTERGSRVPPLPRLEPGEPLPTCRQTVHRGVAIHG